MNRLTSTLRFQEPSAITIAVLHALPLRLVIGHGIVDPVEVRMATELVHEQAVLDVAATAAVGGNVLDPILLTALRQLLQHISGIVLGIEALESADLKAVIAVHVADD